MHTAKGNNVEQIDCCTKTQSPSQKKKKKKTAVKNSSNNVTHQILNFISVSKLYIFPQMVQC